MNEFTKDELEKLLLMALKTSDYFSPNDSDPLCLKLQSMIDNYDTDQIVKDSLNYILMIAREFGVKL